MGCLVVLFMTPPYGRHRTAGNNTLSMKRLFLLQELACCGSPMDTHPVASFNNSESTIGICR
jgi:hypothetical protein